MGEKENTMKVLITRYHPVFIDLKLFVLGTTFNFSVINMTSHFFTVSDNLGLKFRTHSEAEAYCQNQEYEWDDA